MATDIPDPTPLDEAIWQLFLVQRESGWRVRGLRAAAERLFPSRMRRLPEQREYFRDYWQRPDVREREQARSRSDHYREYQTTYRQRAAMKEWQSGYGREYYQRRRADILARQRDRGQSPEVRERRNAYQREWRMRPENRERGLERMREYYRTHRSGRKSGAV
jgi:hypothetical protein